METRRGEQKPDGVGATLTLEFPVFQMLQNPVFGVLLLVIWAESTLPGWVPYIYARETLSACDFHKSLTQTSFFFFFLFFFFVVLFF